MLGTRFLMCRESSSEAMKHQRPGAGSYDASTCHESTSEVMEHRTFGAGSYDAARVQGDEVVVKTMLQGARRVLVHAIDENRRRYFPHTPQMP